MNPIIGVYDATMSSMDNRKLAHVTSPLPVAPLLRTSSRPVIASGGSHTVAAHSMPSTVNDELADWISRRSLSDLQNPLQLSRWGRTLQQAINEWKLTGILKLEPIKSFLEFECSRARKIKNLAIVLRSIDAVLYELGSADTGLPKGQSVDAAKYIFDRFMSIASGNENRQDSESEFSQLRRLFLRVLHHHPVFWRSLDAHSNNPSNISKLSSSGFGNKIHALRYLYENNIKLSDTELDDLMRSRINSKKLIPKEVTKILDSRTHLTLARKPNPLCHETLDESGSPTGTSVPHAAPSGTRTASGILNETSIPSGKREQPDGGAEENAAPSKRHRSESYGPRMPLPPDSMGGASNTIGGYGSTGYLPPPSFPTTAEPPYPFQQMTVRPGPAQQVWRIPTGYIALQWMRYDYAPREAGGQSSNPVMRSTVPTPNSTATVVSIPMQAPSGHSSPHPSPVDALPSSSRAANLPGAIEMSGLEPDTMTSWLLDGSQPMPPFDDRRAEYDSAPEPSAVTQASDGPDRPNAGTTLPATHPGNAQHLSDDMFWNEEGS